MWLVREPLTLVHRQEVWCPLVDRRRGNRSAVLLAIYRDECRSGSSCKGTLKACDGGVAQGYQGEFQQEICCWTSVRDRHAFGWYDGRFTSVIRNGHSAIEGGDMTCIVASGSTAPAGLQWFVEMPAWSNW